MIYWFYGQPGSGKTTLAKSLLEKIDAIHVDGDDVRKIFNNQDYSKDGRIKNLTNINNIVRFLDHKGFNVVVSVVSPYKEIRDQLLDLGIKYYYVTTSEIRGKEDFFVKDFQIGENDIILDTTNKSSNEILAIYW
jgi:adenylylsulfate kinase-like enzyme